MSEKLYEFLLRLYPEHFRRTYGDEALRLVRERAGSEKGFLTGLRLWMDLVLDLALSLPREYRRAPGVPTAVTQPLNGEPSFQLLVEGSLHPTLLCLAGALSAVLLWMCVSVVGHAGIFPLSFAGSDSLQGIVENALAQVTAAPASGGGAKHWVFEVVSIRRHTAASGPPQRPTTTPDGFRSIGLPMGAIFQMAYAPPNQRGLLRGDLIAGTPGWLADEPYDIVARIDAADLADWRKPEMTQTMLRAMLQAMLAERCKAVVHHESKEVPVYDLVVAKGGPKFKAAETTDVGELRQKHPAGGMMMGTGTMAVEGPNGRQLFYAIPTTVLANTILPGVLDRPVADKTGLAGSYDLALPSTALRPPLPPPAGVSSPDALSPGPQDESIFAALEALGLRLEPAKGRVEMLVIDHVERPSEN